MYFLAHCWEFFFPFYLAVRLVWPKIRIDFFLPFNWASEKNGPWLAVHYLFTLILGSSAMSAHSLRSNFVFPFTWASHLLAKLEVIILLPCPWAFHFKPATFIHKIIWFCRLCLGFIYYPGLTFAQWAANKYF